MLASSHWYLVLLSGGLSHQLQSERRNLVEMALSRQASTQVLHITSGVATAEQRLCLHVPDLSEGCVEPGPQRSGQSEMRGPT